MGIGPKERDPGLERLGRVGERTNDISPVPLALPAVSFMQLHVAYSQLVQVSLPTHRKSLTRKAPNTRSQDPNRTAATLPPSRGRGLTSHCLEGGCTTWARGVLERRPVVPGPMRAPVDLQCDIEADAFDLSGVKGWPGPCDRMSPGPP